MNVRGNGYTHAQEKMDQMKEKMGMLQVSQRTGFQVQEGPLREHPEVIHSSVQQLRRHLLFRE